MRSWLRAFALVSIHCAALAVLCYGAYVGFIELRDYLAAEFYVPRYKVEPWIVAGVFLLGGFAATVAMVRDWSSGGTRIECYAVRMVADEPVECEGNHTPSMAHSGKLRDGTRLRWVA